MQNHMLTSDDERTTLATLSVHPEDQWLTLLYSTMCKKVRISLACLEQRRKAPGLQFTQQPCLNHQCESSHTKMHQLLHLVVVYTAICWLYPCVEPDSP